MWRKKEIKFFTKRKLLEANRHSIGAGHTRCLKKELIEQLPDDKLFPVLMRVISSEPRTRLCVVINDEGSTCVIDVSPDTYQRLPKLLL